MVMLYAPSNKKYQGPKQSDCLEKIFSLTYLHQTENFVKKIPLETR